ncbi:MAG: sigma-54 dependent transcriptional regulator [Polyangiales bacterium]
MSAAGLAEKVLVVDDEPGVGVVLGAILRQDGIASAYAPDGPSALAALAAGDVDVVVSDLRMPGMDGMALLAEIQRADPGVPVILLTAHGSVSLAVEAMRAGAADFVLKPFDRTEILFAVRKALALAKAARATPPAAPPPPSAPEGFVGRSAAMRAVYDLLRRAAASQATVLLRGESGTGKEVAARALHAASPRRDGPFVKVQCAALPETLLEAELFGHEKGAFTGAVQRKPGRFELAQGGTLFLDEVGDISPAVQVKLLSVLQDRRFERVGGTQSLEADVRLVAATHRDLDAMARAGTFREDLFYRLNVVPVRLPPLRDRGDDVRDLAVHFCGVAGRVNGRPDARLDPGAVDVLAARPWPGNVRQLQNFVERLVVLAPDARITADHARDELAREDGPATSPPPASITAGGAIAGHDGALLDAYRRDSERRAIRDALDRADGNRTLAAKILGISRRMLQYKLAELDIA